MAYTTQQNIEDKLGTNLTDAQASFFVEVVDPAVDAYINGVIGTAYAANDAYVVYASGNDTSTLVIPTMSTITKVEEVADDGTLTAVDASTYAAYPRSGGVYAIRRLSDDWACGVENYKVTGTIAGDIPADIVLVATELAVNVLNQNSGNYKSEKVGDWSVTYSDVQQGLSPGSLDILHSYRRLSRSI